MTGTDSKPRFRSDQHEMLLPNTLATERSILGAVLMLDSLFAATAVLRVEDFSISSHRLVYRRMRDLAETSRPIDWATVSEELARHQELDQLGGSAFLAALLDGVPENPHVEHYVDTLREAAALRDICKTLEGLLTINSKRPTLAEVLLHIDGATKRPRQIVEDINRGKRLLPYLGQSAADGAELLAEIAGFVNRFVLLTPMQATVIALWIMHTHAFDSADATPYLAITSAEKRSGKTRLLEVMRLLVAKPWFTGHVTAASLTRKINEFQPTLLLDESDAAFNGDREYTEALRGLLNSGHRSGGTSSLCVGKGAEMKVQDFHTFCPKAIAGIGRLPDTVADRSIPIRMKRKVT